MGSHHHVIVYRSVVLHFCFSIYDMKRITGIAIMAAFILSCSKPIDNPLPVETPVTVKKIKEIRNAPNDYRAYQFNENGQLKEYFSQFTSRTDGAVSQYSVQFSYENNRLVKAQVANGYYLYKYAAGKLVTIESYNYKHELFSTTFLTINHKNQLLEKLEQFKVPQSQETGEIKTNYQYNVAGNLTRADHYSRSSLSDPLLLQYSQLFLQYDNKPAVSEEWSTDFFLPGIALVKNNPGVVQTLDAQGIAERRDRFEYKYNSEGLVTEKKHFVENTSNTVIPITFTYQYW